VLEDLGPPEFASTEAAGHDELRLVARRQLVDELGVDPGAKLRDLETPILRHDPALLLPDARPAEVGIVTPASPVPNALSEAMQPGGPMAVFDTFVRLLTAR
jgi:hypothetical protein